MIHNCHAKRPARITCPECGHTEATTACRFCGKSKLPNPIPIDFTAVPLDEPPGAVKVKFKGRVKCVDVEVLAVIAPADPEVGLLFPYPIEMSAFDCTNTRVPLTYQDARYLTSTVSGQLF